MNNMIERRHNGPVLTLALNRPETHNALNPEMIAELTRAFADIRAGGQTRVIVLTGNGPSFCAGADLAAMRAAADYSFEQNLADSRTIFDLMMAVDHCPVPVVGRINGAAIGGGVGLVSCCDIAVAAADAVFGLSEARLGLAPAVISPFVIAKIGTGNARELFLTGERFSAERAQAIGLVQHLATQTPDAAGADALDEAVSERVRQLLLAAPGAQAAIKDLIRVVSAAPAGDLREATSQVIATRRASDEGREGMSAFLEKRRPAWQTPRED